MATAEQPHNLLDQALDEFISAIRRGENPSVDEYANRYGALSHEIRRLFPVVAYMERSRLAVADPERPAPSLPGRLGDYEIIREVGRGGMGVVYEAQQISLQRHVALKTLPLAASQRPELLERFRHEAIAAARLHHTNIVPVHGIGDSDGWHYLIMQLIIGRSLAELSGMRRQPGQAANDTDSQSDTEAASFGRPPASAIAERSSTPPTLDREWYRYVANVGLQAADALAYAHAQGVLHRDIKPSNLIVDGHDIVWITDFGLAKVAGIGDLTATGDVPGTIRYLAPERLRGENDARSDLFSLGLVLYELLLGRPAYDSADRPSLLKQVMEATPPAPRRLAPGIPRDLETIVQTCIRHDPAHRYQSAGQLAEDCRSFLDGRTISARRATPVERLLRWSRRNKALAASLATVALLLAVVAAGSLAAAIHFRKQEAVQRELAEDLRRNLYDSDMIFAEQSLHSNNIARARELLTKQLPHENEKDLRGWEWRYAWQLTNSRAKQTVASPFPNVMTVRFANSSQCYLCDEYEHGLYRCDIGPRSTLQPVSSKLRCQTFDVNRDGTLVAIAEQSKQVTVWQLDQMKRLATLPHPAEFAAVAFAPDGSVLATTSHDGKTRIWNWKDQKLIHEIGGVSYGNSQFRPLAFAPSGDFVVSGGGDGTIRSIDARSGTVIWSQPAHKEAISALAIAPDGHIVASVSGYSASEIKLWDEQGKLVDTLGGHTAWVSGLVFSPDGRFLVSSGSDQTVRIWDYVNRRELAVLRSPSPVLCVAVSPDSKLIVSGGGSREISVWDTDLKLYQEPPLTVAGRTEMAAYSPDGALYLVHNGAVEAYDPLTLEPIGNYRELGVRNRSIAVSADGRKVAAGGEDGHIRVWDCETDKVVTEIPAFNALVYKLAFMPDDATLVSVSPKGEGYLVQHWSLRDSRQLSSWTAPCSLPYFGSELWPWVVLPKLNLYVTRKNGELNFWDLTSGKLRHRLSTGHSTVDGVAFSPGGKLLATGGWEGAIKIWDPQAGREIRRLKEHLDGVHGLAFSNDGTRLVSGSNGREAIKVWDTTTWRVLATLPGRGSQFKALNFSPGDRSLVAIPNDRLLHLWPAPGLLEIDSDSTAGQ